MKGIIAASCSAITLL